MHVVVDNVLLLESTKMSCGTLFSGSFAIVSKSIVIDL
jgi:hypothetical protein